MPEDRRDVGRTGGPRAYTGDRDSAGTEVGSVAQAADREESDRLAEIRQRLRQRRRRAQAAAARAAQAAREKASGTGRQAARGAAGAVSPEDADEAIAADVFVDRRKKSRLQEVAERAEGAATVRPPVDATLEPTGDDRKVSDMARAGADRATLLAGGGGDAGLDVNADARVDGLVLTGEAEADDTDETDDELAFADPFGVTGGDAKDDEGGWLL